MYQKRTPDFYHTKEYQNQTRCQYTGEVYRTCPYIYKKGMVKYCCGFRATAETKKERLLQILTHISGGHNCSILYLKFMEKMNERKMNQSLIGIYINWVIDHYQPQNEFQSPLNREWIKPYNEDQKLRVNDIIIQAPEIYIPHNTQVVVSRLIWERRGKPEGKDHENWKVAANMLKKYWFWSRNRNQEEILEHHGPVWTKLHLMVTDGVRELDPNYQRQRKTQALQSYQFYQKQITRIQRELECL